MELAELNDYRKVLSLQWQLNTDKIVFKLLPIYEFTHLLTPKKRHILKTASMFYDPLGLLILITVKYFLINLQTKICMGHFFFICSFK